MRTTTLRLTKVCVGFISLLLCCICIRRQIPYTSCPDDKQPRHEDGLGLMSNTVSAPLGKQLSFGLQSIKLDEEETGKQFGSTDGKPNLQINETMSRGQNKKIETNSLWNAYYIRDMCNHIDSHATYIKARTPVFFYSKYNGLLACKSPKAGSTLLGALVRALTRKSDNEVFDMFLLGRNEIHNGLNEVFGPMTAKVIKESALTVMVTRDPFSRLYSTFIDKYFLLGRLGREIATHLKRGFKEENEDYCGYDVTFQEFLDYVVYLAENMVEMNEHMVPVAQICDVCNIKYDLVCRQENLTQGAEEVLRLTNNVTSSRLDAMRKSMTSKYASVFTLVSSHLFDYNNNRQDCPNKMIFMAKMWKTFAIQGLVNSGLDFPEHIFSQFSFVAREAHNITSAILQVTKSKPLSKVNRRLQRLKFLSEAYRDIRWQTIAKLQKVYYLDFLLFGYSKLPPTYYSER